MQWREAAGSRRHTTSTALCVQAVPVHMRTPLIFATTVDIGRFHDKGASPTDARGASEVAAARRHAGETGGFFISYRRPSLPKLTAQTLRQQWPRPRADARARQIRKPPRWHHRGQPRQPIHPPTPEWETEAGSLPPQRCTLQRKLRCEALASASRCTYLRP